MFRVFDICYFFKNNKGTLDTELNNKYITYNKTNDVEKWKETYEGVDE